MKRRTYLATAGALGSAGMAGCQSALFGGDWGPEFTDDFDYEDSPEEHGWELRSGDVETEESLLTGDGSRGRPFDVVAREIGSMTGRFTFEGVVNRATFFGLKIGFFDGPDPLSAASGYRFRIEQRRNNVVDFRRREDGDEEVVGPVTDAHGGEPHHYAVDRTGAGDLAVYYDGDEVVSGTFDDEFEVTHLTIRFDSGREQWVDGVSTEPF